MAINLTSLLLGQAFTDIIGKLKFVKASTQTAISQIDTGATADQIISMMRGLKTSLDIINAAKSAPGLAQYAKDQYWDAAFDIAAEINASVSAMNTAVLWIETNMPKDANGYLLKDRIVNGNIENRVFTPAQLAGLKTQLNAILSTLA